jgi:predicted ABC-type ATPase
VLKIPAHRQAPNRWLSCYQDAENIELAKERVKTRVKEGGHNIPNDIIERRYLKGIKNLFDIYLEIVDGALIFDNSYGKHELIAQKFENEKTTVLDTEKFNRLKKYYDK